MIKIDEDALICDLAETYHIYDYRSLPCKTVATFSCGLRNDSRIKMKMAGMNVTPEQMLLSAIVDNTKLLAWLNSKDGTDGVNRPTSLLGILMGNDTDENNNVVTFNSGQEFDDEWKRLKGKEGQ